MFLFTLTIFLISVVLSFAFTWLVRHQAQKRGWVSAPQSERHIHVRPVPRIGGIAVFAALVLSLGVAYLFLQRVPLHAFRVPMLLTLLVPGTIVFLLGLCDDVFGVGPYWKFLVQALAAVMVFAGGLRINILPILFGNRQLGFLLSLVLTVLWVLWITNAFNLIDGLDGLAAGSALFSTVVVFVVSAMNGYHFNLLVTAVLSGALLGFLRFNFNPATIFLGDCGSLFVGFMLGSLALQGQKSPTMVAVAIPLVSCGLPILEIFLSIGRRFLSGKPLFEADRGHIHHQLLKRGLTPRQATLLLYGVSAVFGLLSLFLLLPGGAPVAVVLCVIGAIVWIGVQHLGYHEVFELQRVAQRTIDQKQVIVNNLAVRRAISSLEQCGEFRQICERLNEAFADNAFDGFDLYFTPSNGSSPKNGKPAFRHCWRRPGVNGDLGWRLELPLPVTNNGTGSLSLYRKYSDNGLMLDINILTSSFPGVLAEALQRAAARAEAVPDRPKSAAAAAAGADAGATSPRFTSGSPS